MLDASCVGIGVPSFSANLEGELLAAAHNVGHASPSKVLLLAHDVPITTPLSASMRGGEALCDVGYFCSEMRGA